MSLEHSPAQGGNLGATEQRRMLPPADAGLYLGLSPATLATWRTRGGGPAYLKLGSKILYERDVLDAWLDARRRTSTSEAA